MDWISLPPPPSLPSILSFCVKATNINISINCTLSKLMHAVFPSCFCSALSLCLAFNTSLKINNTFYGFHLWVINVRQLREEIKIYFILHPFHKTLPKSRAFINRISVRFYETDCLWI